MVSGRLHAFVLERGLECFNTYQRMNVPQPERALQHQTPGRVFGQTVRGVSFYQVVDGALVCLFYIGKGKKRRVSLSLDA